MSKVKTCKGCLYICGPLNTGKARFICVHSSEPTQEDTVGCPHHCPKTGWKAFARRLCNLLVLKETRLLEAEANPDTIAHIIATHETIASVVHREENG